MLQGGTAAGSQAGLVAATAAAAQQQKARSDRVEVTSAPFLTDLLPFGLLSPWAPGGSVVGGGHGSEITVVDRRTITLFPSTCRDFR